MKHYLNLVFLSCIALGGHIILYPVSLVEALSFSLSEYEAPCRALLDGLLHGEGWGCFNISCFVFTGLG